MSENVDQPKGTAVFERKLSAPMPQYEHAQGFISIQFPVDFADPDATADAAERAFLAAQLTVLEKLGIPFDFDEATRRITERPIAVQSSPATGTGGGMSVGQVADQTGGAPLCPVCNGEMWDNRAKATGNQPIFRCKAAKWNAAAKRNDGCDGVIFKKDWNG